MYKIILICLLTGIGSVNANIIDRNVLDTGVYTNTGNSSAIDIAYTTGTIGSGVLRSFFVFSLGVVPNTATSATLQLFTFNISGPGILKLFDVTTDISSLRSGGSGLTDIYTDLADGIFYGDIILNDAQSDQVIQITLNSDALTDINNSGGLFAIGASYTTPDGLSDSPDFSFGFSTLPSADNALLLEFDTDVVIVSIPATFWLFGLGFIGIARIKKEK